MRKPTLSILAVAALSTASACGPQLEPAELDALNGELSSLSHREVITQRDRFAALCDARGYPLVGNIVSKDPRATASSFCNELRQRP